MLTDPPFPDWDSLNLTPDTARTALVEHVKRQDMLLDVARSSEYTRGVVELIATLTLQEFDGYEEQVEDAVIDVLNRLYPPVVLTVTVAAEVLGQNLEAAVLARLTDTTDFDVLTVAVQR